MILNLWLRGLHKIQAWESIVNFNYTRLTKGDDQGLRVLSFLGSSIQDVISSFIIYAVNFFLST